MDKMKKIITICLCAVMIIVLFGCTFSDGEDSGRAIEEVEERTKETTTESTTESSTKANTENTTESNTESTTEGSTSGNSEISSASDIPEYSGDAYVVLNNNIPSFTDEEKKRTDAFEEYSNLDSKGRCGVAFANICKELMPTEKRGEIGGIRPSGWHTIKYPDLIEDNYLYNRSHLIAYSLAGENANEKNLITGTRYLNQETMQIFELKLLDYVRAHDVHVLYRVTPVFEGDNLLATGVQMEAWSVEDGGKDICFNVFCYNIQPGIDIDYATGDSKRSEDEGAQKKSEENTTADSSVTTEAATQNDDNVSDFEKRTMTFILNTNTRKIHLPDCRSVNDMADHNKLECESTIADLKRQGYTPCGRCLAEYR
ncbi:MAG: DNA/RNA non-specific endonuclease [Eubacterium sp.]|nr:DNA/RNA non-specific endonuclease [Eubacterium sp.]